MTHPTRLAAALCLCTAALAQDAGVVPYSDQHVVAMYVSGDVTDYARAAGMEYWAYVGRLLDDVRAMGFTVVHPNNLMSEDLPRWLDLAEARGLRLIYQGGAAQRDYYVWNPNDPVWGEAITPQERRRLFRSEMLPFYRDVLLPRHRVSRALLGYCATEEIMIEDDPTIWEDLRELTEASRRVDPLHPVFVEHLWADQVVRSLPVQRPEVVLYGPGTIGSGPWNQELDFFEVWLQEVSFACRQNGTTLYAVVNSVQEQVEQDGRWVPRVWEPSTADIALQAWLSYANGAQGVDFWWYHTIEDNLDGRIIRFRGVEGENGRRTPMWNTMREVTSQLAPLSRHLPKLRVVEDNGGLPYDREGSWVRMRLLRMPDSGEAYLLAVNKNTSRQEAIGFDLSSILPVGARATRVPDGAIVDPVTLEVPPGQGVLLRLGRLRGDVGSSRVWAGFGAGGGGLAHGFGAGGTWRLFPWTQYNQMNGEVRPACGDLDGVPGDEDCGSVGGLPRGYPGRMLPSCGTPSADAAAPAAPASSAGRSPSASTCWWPSS